VIRALLVTIACAAVVPQAAAPAAGVITGDVRLAVDVGDSVPSVEVWVVDSASRREVARAMTDRSGQFTLQVPPGRYLVSGRRTGYLETSYGSAGSRLPAMPLVVSAGQRASIRLVIHRCSILDGVVRDDRGTPLDHATVAILRPSSTVAEDRVAAHATTDENGEYRIETLLPGEYLAAASAERPTGVSLDGLPGGVPVPQFFPGADTRRGATPLVLHADEERSGIDFTLPRRPLSSLTGVVVAPEGVTLRDDAVAIVTGADETAPMWAAPPLRSGRFTLLLPPGRYRVDVRAAGRSADQPSTSGRPYFASATVDVPDAAPITQELRLHAGLQVSGRVRALEGAAPPLRVRLTPTVDRQAAVRPVEAAVASDGLFTAEDVPPGRYGVEVIAADRSWVLDAVRFHGRRREEPVIDLDGPVGADDLELAVAPITAAVSGRLLGVGDAASAYVVGLLDLDRSGRGPMEPWVSLARPDEQGTFRFSKLRSGRHLLFLLRNDDVAVLENRTALGALRTSTGVGVRLTLAAGVETPMDLRVGPGS
jgi:Carboxypeptidase regulatory-like domain